MSVLVKISGILREQITSNHQVRSCIWISRVTLILPGLEVLKFALGQLARCCFCHAPIFLGELAAQCRPLVQHLPIRHEGTGTCSSKPRTHTHTPKICWFNDRFNVMNNGMFIDGLLTTSWCCAVTGNDWQWQQENCLFIPRATQLTPPAQRKMLPLELVGSLFLRETI